MRLSRQRLLLGLTIGVPVAVLAFGVFLAIRPPLMGDVSFSRAVFDRHGELLRLTISKDEKYRLFVPLPEIAPTLVEGVLLHEDQHFYSHPGINPAALGRALLTYVGGGRKMGASTVTMQLARIKTGVKSRHMFGKLAQMLYALRLELHYTKPQLFEAYLNLVPYGQNIEGVGAASFIYLKKKPSELTLPESLTLAVIPQNPNKRRPERLAPAKPALLDARNRLFVRWLEEHPEAADQKPFFSLPLATFDIGNLPFEAPHVVVHMLSRYPDEQQITTSIDLRTQQLLERLIRGYVKDQREIGIHNASAMLLDTRSMQVVASIGSANFYNKSIGGQVDGTRARRSPGSALKPFIYALAFDQGLIHPMSVLGDAPTSFGSYSPDNFDRDFRGPIPAGEALRMSRNVPAIKLASQLRSPDLYGFFKQAGVQKLHEKKDYGLSLVLGGADVAMRELVELYAMLANDGVKQDALYRNIASTPGPRLLTPEASFMTLDAMRDTVRPHNATSAHAVYWKTGTSNGFRDAWTAGVFGPYVLVVWVGDFSGKNNPALVGIRTAAPLFFQIVGAMHQQAPQPELIARKAEKLHLRKLDVCATTGDLSLDGCPAAASTWFIPGVSPIERHDVYRKILVNIHTGKRACDYEEGVTEYQQFEVWPSELRQALRKSGINKPLLPEAEADCEKSFVEANSRAPVIASPQASIEYHARTDNAPTEAIPLSANSDGDAESLHWFINDIYFGKSRPGESIAWRPKPGRYTVRVVDDQGRAASTRMTVALVQ